jgi:hypothetical protein
MTIARMTKLLKIATPIRRTGVITKAVPNKRGAGLLLEEV